MLTAIFGGTFNPLHIGHYEILKSLQEDPKIEKIFLVPDRLPPHKTSEFLVDDNIRIEMCRMAAEDFSKCELLLIEFEREGKSYTIDTVKLLCKKFPNKEFAFVCGGDMLVYFDKWYCYKELMKILPFIVFKRSDTDDKDFNECISKFQSEGMSIILKDEIITSVSSTQIRNKFLDSHELIPDKIFNFLKKSGVYIAEN